MHCNNLFSFISLQQHFDKEKEGMEVESNLNVALRVLKDWVNRDTELAGAAKNKWPFTLINKRNLI